MCPSSNNLSFPYMRGYSLKVQLGVISSASHSHIYGSYSESGLYSLILSRSSLYIRGYSLITEPWIKVLKSSHIYGGYSSTRFSNLSQVYLPHMSGVVLCYRTKGYIEISLSIYVGVILPL